MNTRKDSRLIYFYTKKWTNKSKTRFVVVAKNKTLPHYTPYLYKNKSSFSLANLLLFPSIFLLLYISPPVFTFSTSRQLNFLLLFIINYPTSLNVLWCPLFASSCCSFSTLVSWQKAQTLAIWFHSLVSISALYRSTGSLLSIWSCDAHFLIYVPSTI